MKSVFYKIFDYSDPDVFYYEGDPFKSNFKSYQNCMFEIEYPELNKYRVVKVDVPNQTIWMRQAKGKDFNDDAYMKCPIQEKGKTPMQILLENGDDELDENGNPIIFPILFNKIKLRFYCDRKLNKEDSIVYEDIFQ